MPSLKRWLGGDTDALVLRVFPFLARQPLGPDALTLLGVASSAAAALAYYRGSLPVAGLLLVLAGFFDLADGVVARQRGQVTLAGGFTDSSLDRLADMLVFGGITLGSAARGEQGLALLSFWAATAAILVSYTRARAEVHLHRFDHGSFGRAERFAVLLAGTFTGWLAPAVGLLALGTSVTALGRILTGRRLLSELERTGLDPTAPPGDSNAGGAAR